jgi:hypothetical protein
MQEILATVRIRPAFAGGSQPIALSVAGHRNYAAGRLRLGCFLPPPDGLLIASGPQIEVIAGGRAHLVIVDVEEHPVQVSGVDILEEQLRFGLALDAQNIGGDRFELGIGEVGCRHVRLTLGIAFWMMSAYWRLSPRIVRPVTAWAVMVPIMFHVKALATRGQPPGSRG